MATLRSVFLVLIPSVVLLTEGLSEAQPVTAAYVSDAKGVWLLNKQTTLRAAQPLPGRGVVTFSSRDGLEPARIVIRDLQGMLIDSRECKSDGCAPSPLVVPGVPDSRRIPGAESFEVLYRRVMNTIFSKPAYPINAASRSVPASCRDGIAWESAGVLSLTDMLTNGGSDISTLQFRKLRPDPADTSELTVSRTSSGWHVQLQPGLYDVTCSEKEHVWVLVVSPVNSTDTLKTLSEVRGKVASWVDQDDGAGYRRFIRGYLDLLSSGTPH